MGMKHVHVYVVSGLIEVDVEAPDEEIARELAIEKAKKLLEYDEFTPSDPDTRLIAVGPLTYR